MQPVLNNALSSEPGTPFHTMALNQLQRCASKESGVEFLMTNPSLIDGMLAVFLDEQEIGPYEIVAKTLVTLSKHFEARTMAFFFKGGSSTENPSVFDTHLAQDSETIRIRILDLFASISILSESWFELLDGRGYISKIFGELEENDLLARLSAFQLLGKVCSSPKGLEAMRKYGAASKLVAMLDVEADGLNNIVLSNAITVIGELASFNDLSFEIMVKEQPTLISALHAHIEHDSDEVVQSVIFALARISCTEPGLKLILSEDNKIIVRHWLEYGHSSNAEMKATTFYSLSIVLDRLAKVESCRDLTQHLYARMGFADYPSLELVHKNLTGGLSELKYAALTLLRSTLRYDWGELELVRFPGLTDWLLDRSSENTKKGHELKYEAMQQAIQHPDAKKLLGLSNYHNFLEFLKLGVYYQRAESAVMVREEHG